MRITRCLVLIFWLLCAILLPGSWLPGARVDAEQGPQPTVLDGEEVIVGHLADEHLGLDAPASIEYERLREALRVMKRLNVDLLISTGDLTEANAPYSYQMYIQILGQVGSFSTYPNYGPGIPFRPVAGNHDYYGISPWPQYMGPSQHSFTIGNYRFIGFSGDPNKGIPEDWLESEMKKSCRDGKWIVLYHHYPPNGWMSGELDMNAQSWAKLDALAQKYPVVAYLAGHNHQERGQAIPPGYFVHTAGRTGAGYYTVYSLRNG
ncbi:MAG: metallophosphoesterase, partial [Chloroflexi bacterium]|nr:metallophosphoesterase [Chloroflexota bacterium]